MWVKVCGLTRASDVSEAVAAGADAVGFVLADSPRRLDPASAARLIAAVPATVESIVLTVDATESEAAELIERVGAGGIQPYGDHAAAVAAWAISAGLRVLRPVPSNRLELIESCSRLETPLIDTYDPARLGGTGRRFDWTTTGGIDRPFVLAGGLGPDNVAEAVRVAAPWGVDASSGLESAPGRKDPARIRAFVEGAKT